MDLDLADETLASDAETTASGVLPVETVASSALRPLEAGASIDRYVVLHRVGAGAMGVVYAAYDPQLDRRVALKLVQQSVAPSASRAEARRARLLREAQALARLSHPNVVAVHDAGVVDGQVFVAMEFVEGRTLADYVRETEPSWRQTLHALLDAARGLAAAHDKGLVHRDVKPSNIMVGEDGRVRVMDFGLVRPGGGEKTPRPSPPLASTLDEDPGLTRDGAAVGTLAYMPPEQHTGLDVDAHSDQFAWCVSAWQMLYGQLPFAGQDALSIATSIAVDERRPPPSDSPVPAWVRRALDRGLRLDPKQRWPDMKTLVGVLERGERIDRRRSWFAAAGVAIAIGGGLVGWRAWTQRADMRACTQTADAIAEVWPGTEGEARQRLRAAIEAAGTDVARATGERIEGLLDDWTADYATTRRRVCEVELDGAWPQAQVDAAHDCFAEAREAATGVLEELSNADTDVMLHGVGAVSGLPRTTKCAEEGHLQLRPAVPEGADAEVAEIRRLLATSAGVLAAGRDVSIAVGPSETALNRAEALGWPHLVAKARSQLAAVRNQEGKFDEAASLLVQVFDNAAERDDAEFAFDAAVSLCRQFAERDGRTAEASTWCHAARAALARTWDPASLSHARWLLAQARVDSTDGDQQLARSRAEEALRLLSATPGQPPMAVSDAYDMLAKIAWRQRDLAASREYVERVRELTAARFGPEHPNVAEIISNEGVLYTATSDWKKASYAFERAYAIRAAAYGKHHPVVAHSLLNLGYAQLQTQQFQASVASFERAVATMEAIYGPDSAEVARALTGLGTAMYDSNLDEDPEQYREAAKVVTRAIDISKRTLGENHNLVSTLYYNLSRIREGQGRDAEALELVRKATESCIAERGAEHPDCGSLMGSLASTAADQGDAETARQWYERAIEVLDDAQSGGDRLVNARFGLAKVLVDVEGEHGRAIELAEAALAEAPKYAGMPGIRTPERISAWLDEHR